MFKHIYNHQNNRYDKRIPQQVAPYLAGKVFGYISIPTWAMCFEAHMYSGHINKNRLNNYFSKSLFFGYIIEEGTAARRDIAPADCYKSYVTISDDGYKYKLNPSHYHSVMRFDCQNMIEYLQDIPTRIEHLFGSRLIYGDRELYNTHQKQIMQKIRSMPDKYSFKGSFDFEYLIKNLGVLARTIDDYLISLVARGELSDEFFLKMPVNTSKKWHILYDNGLIPLEFWQIENFYIHT